MEGATDYEVFFVHQWDNRLFNRGAMKNIGFIAMKEKYPDSYKTMTFIFHDVDTLPFNKLFSYDTDVGVVTHYYGFDTALGGIVVMKGGDFERVNGYPSYWGWGMEDACLQKRCLIAGLRIDRSQFFPIGSPEILQLFDGVDRLVSSKDSRRMVADTGFDGIRTIHNLIYELGNESLNPSDNLFVVEDTLHQYVNVTSFSTAVNPNTDVFHKYDLRDPIRNITHPQTAPTIKTKISVADWKKVGPRLPFNAIQKPVQTRPRATASAHIGLGGLRR